jgi:hypothetical protein
MICLNLKIILMIVLINLYRLYKINLLFAEKAAKIYI